MSLGVSFEQLQRQCFNDLKEIVALQWQKETSPRCKGGDSQAFSEFAESQMDFNKQVSATWRLQMTCGLMDPEKGTVSLFQPFGFLPTFLHPLTHQLL